MAGNETINNFDWDNIEKRDMNFINIDKEENEITVRMQENAPFDIVDGSRTKYKKDIFMFKVLDNDGDERVFSTSSNRCLMALKEHRPLKGKILRIRKEGSGMDTQYFVDEMKD